MFVANNLFISEPTNVVSGNFISLTVELLDCGASEIFKPPTIFTSCDESSMFSFLSELLSLKG
jgi:hypothetical protein